MQSILFISLMNSDPWGGSEVQWFEAAKYAQQNGYKVTCLVYSWQNKLVKLQPIIELGGDVFYIPNTGRSKKNIWQRLRYEWITKLQQIGYIKKFDFSKYDYVVVNQGGFMEVANSPWKNIYKRLNKYVLTFHNYTPNFSFKSTKKKSLISWMKNAHLNIGDAARIGKILEEQLNINLNSFASLVNPITITQSTTYTNYPPLFNGNYKMVMLAQLDVARKAQDNLIEVFAMPVWKSRNVILELFGDGEHFELLQQLIDKHNLKNKVFLKGNTNEVEKELGLAHLVLQITHKDAMPISVVEAMSKSRTVVVSNVGDMPLWVENDINGWVAEDASIEKISEVLEIAWSKREQWELMGKHGFDFFRKNYPTNVAFEFIKKVIY
jgi:glycosyltransferase involved in cell wall biosynthesis